MIENVPVIMAWLPTTAAMTAITSTGHLNVSRGKNGRYKPMRRNSTSMLILMHSEIRKSL